VVAAPSALPAVPPQAASEAHGAALAAHPPVVRSPWWSGPIPWAIAGAAAGAIGIAVFLWTGTERYAADADTRIKEIQVQLAEAQKRLAEVGERDVKARDQVLALLAEQQKLEESKRRQEEQARLAEQNKLEEERRRIEEERRKLAARPSKPAAAPAAKVAPPAEIVTRPRPPILPVEPEPVEAPPVEAPPVVAVAKPKPDPQLEQLKRGEAALARREYEKALEILRPLAQAGNARAQDRLAGMYADGLGVPRNNNQAYIWYSLAAQGGGTTASAERDRIAKLMQPAEIRQADYVVQNWRPR
jgi:hypothetical protein